MARSSKLYNKDLAPTPKKDKNWGWFEIFNVWANDVQSLFGYTLAASLFLTYGLNGWAVFLAIISAVICKNKDQSSKNYKSVYFSSGDQHFSISRLALPFTAIYDPITC